MNTQLKFCFYFSVRSEVDEDCSCPADVQAIYRQYGRSLEHTVEKVMSFLTSYAQDAGERIAFATGSQGCPHSVSIINQNELEVSLVGWFADVYFSVAYEHCKLVRAQPQFAQMNAYAEVVVTAESYGGAQVLILQRDGKGGMEECQSVAILPVFDNRQVGQGKMLRGMTLNR